MYETNAEGFENLVKSNAFGYFSNWDTNLQTLYQSAMTSASGVRKLDADWLELIDTLSEAGVELDENAVLAVAYGDSVDGVTESVKMLSDKEAEYYINALKNGQTLTEEQQKQLDAYKAANEEKTASLMELSESEAQYLITAQINGQTLTEDQQEMVAAYKEAHAEQAESYAELAQREKEINDTRVEQARQTESEIELNTETSLEKRTQTMLKNQESVKQAQDDYNKMMKHARDTGNKNLEAFLQQLDITSVEA